MKRIKFSAVLFLLAAGLFAAAPGMCLAANFPGDKAALGAVSTLVSYIEKADVELAAQPNMSQGRAHKLYNERLNNAEEIIDIMAGHFLARSIKPAGLDNMSEYSDYVSKISMVHKIIFYAEELKERSTHETYDKMMSVIKELESKVAKDK